MNKKKIIIIVIVVVLLAIILPLSLIDRKKVDTDNLGKVLLKEFPELNLRVLEREEIMDYFGVTIDDDYEALFITDYQKEDNPKPFNPNVLIVIVNDSNYEEIQNSIKSYIDSEINNIDDYERIKLFQEATIKTKRNYYYLVIGDDKNIVKTIDNYIK